MAETKDVERADGATQNELRQRRQSGDRRPSVASRPFAGRIGGNQEFTLSPSDSEYHEIVSKVPDATPTFTWRQSLSPSGFRDVELWKEATIEGVGTCLQIYIAGLYAIGLGPAATETSLGPITPAAFGSIANVLLISLFIYAGGPVSGGHFNPLITMSTFAARLSAFPRTLLYIIFQCIGAVVAGFLVRASVGAPPASFQAVPGCYINPSLVTPGQAYAADIGDLKGSADGNRYVLETMTSFALVFVAFGVGLDPRQRDVFGPALSPILV